MDLDGAEIRNIENLDISKNRDEDYPLKINIPHYQRPYKWDKEKIQLLIDDFFENYNRVNNLEIADDSEKNDDKEYFAGSIVTVKNDEYQDLIDGQQRITTVFLANFLKFILLRPYIKQLIERMTLSQVKENVSELPDCYSKLIQSKGDYFNKIGTKFDNCIPEIELANDQEEKEKKRDQLKKYFVDKIGLPSVPLEDENYNNEYQEGLEQLFGEEKLNLKYKRTSLNDKLKDALKKILIKLTSEEGPKIDIIEKNEIENNLVEKYAQTVVHIFESFNEKIEGEKESPLQKTKVIIEKISDFLEYLRFCVIQTGDTDDAYKLFEVLNDRSLEVDDLDLIKNLFYRVYCNRSSEEDDEQDEHIEELEDLWGDEIFNENTGVKEKKLVSFLGTIFLTGDTTVKHNEKERYRKTIEKNYLNKRYSRQDKNYNFKNIKFEFEIFQAIKTIINKFEVKFRKTNYFSLKAENRNDVSITYKCFHLLKALGLEGVMPPLVNAILKTYIDNNGDNSNIDMNDFKNFVEDLKNDNNHQDGRFEKIHECADSLWKLSILADGYKIPRDFAKKRIEKINYNEFDELYVTIIGEFKEDAKEEFKSWINDWQYGSSNKKDFKVKLLFLNLINVEKDNNKIKYYNYNGNFNDVENIHLDHFEPEGIDQTKKEKYFFPENTIQRRRYINQLGNFMLLEGEKNSKLGDDPAEYSFDYYDEMGVDENHWIIEEMNELLEKHNSEKDTIDIKVPNENFFNERKKRLQNYFYTLVGMGLRENEMEIEKIKV